MNPKPLLEYIVISQIMDLESERERSESFIDNQAIVLPYDASVSSQQYIETLRFVMSRAAEVAVPIGEGVKERVVLYSGLGESVVRLPEVFVVPLLLHGDANPDIGPQEDVVQLDLRHVPPMHGLSRANIQSTIEHWSANLTWPIEIELTGHADPLTTCVVYRLATLHAGIVRYVSNSK